MKMKTGKLKRHWKRSLLECCTKKQKTKIQFTWNAHAYRARHDFTAKPVRKHTVIVHRNYSHDSNRHCIEICTLSHFYQSYCINTKRLLYKRILTGVLQISTQIMAKCSQRNALHQVEFGRHSAYSLRYAWQIAYHSKNQFQSYALAFVYCRPRNNPTPPPAKSLNQQYHTVNVMQQQVCWEYSLLWQESFLLSLQV